MAAEQKQHLSADEQEEARDKRVENAWFVFAVLCTVALIAWGVHAWQETGRPATGEGLGSMVGGYASAIAFIWLVYSIFMQRMELSTQRRELRLQRKALQAQVEQFAADHKLMAADSRASAMEIYSNDILRAYQSLCSIQTFERPDMWVGALTSYWAAGQYLYSDDWDGHHTEVTWTIRSYEPFYDFLRHLVATTIRYKSALRLPVDWSDDSVQMLLDNQRTLFTSASTIVFKQQLMDCLNFLNQDDFLVKLVMLKHYYEYRIAGYYELPAEEVLTLAKYMSSRNKPPRPDMQEWLQRVLASV